MTFAIYGELLFQPFDIIERWEGNPGARAAAFFCALAWAIGVSRFSRINSRSSN